MSSSEIFSGCDVANARGNLRDCLTIEQIEYYMGSDNLYAETVEALLNILNGVWDTSDATAEILAYWGDTDVSGNSSATADVESGRAEPVANGGEDE